MMLHLNSENTEKNQIIAQMLTDVALRKDLTGTEVFTSFKTNTESARNRISKTELCRFNYSVRW